MRSVEMEPVVAVEEGEIMVEVQRLAQVARASVSEADWVDLFSFRIRIP